MIERIIVYIEKSEITHCLAWHSSAPLDLFNFNFCAPSYYTVCLFLLIIVCCSLKFLTLELNNSNQSKVDHSGCDIPILRVLLDNKRCPFFYNNLFFAGNGYMCVGLWKYGAWSVVVAIKSWSLWMLSKLHSDLRILTQLQLVGVGVDFVFALEGRRRKEEELTLT